ncbi:NUDIX hydrolase [Reinekea marinisedimentorum]|uniref:8-oxo-dGTP pyrophosphatase MutT (NUDIX family) n=1 Tax=Reinekea marinisedimentorum TaxID=230495 RepID=A0A4R3IAX4_9GAMM|nr:NUDIX hydrolase [Reinekea marinisedimentorum]TCS42659.1 8-oxo-dGTP pyrophosphatase MutT (NUDIX family) [Reinekea marinisedimentorum]
MQDQKSVLVLLNQYAAEGTVEQQSLEFIKNFVESNTRYWSRQTLAGHLTASAWITNKEKTRAVLLHHGKLDIWVQPGGHVDDEDESLLLASLREAEEETGLQGLQPVSDGIFDVDVHAIPARKGEPEHNHLDIRFWFIAGNEELTLSDESHELAWLSKAQIEQKTQEESVLRMVRKSLA